jgi:hypothetical protein
MRLSIIEYIFAQQFRMKKMKNLKTIIYLQALLLIGFSSCAQNNTQASANKRRKRRW